MRIFVIGDIHGSDAQLYTVLNKLNPDPGTDRLILLGDLFDRGSGSWEVFRTVQDLEEDFGDRFVLLRGNHEDYLLRTDMSLIENIAWFRVGRRETEKSFRRHGEKMENAIPWLREHTALYYKDDRFQCVHAGVRNGPLEANDKYTLLHDHSIVTRNTYNGFLTITGHIALEKPCWFSGDGKTAESLQYGRRRPLPEQGVICIDTGCGKGGKLTGMAIEDGLYTLFSSL